MAEETLFFLCMAIPDDVWIFATRAAWPLRQLLVDGDNAQHKADDPFYVCFAERFDITKQGIDFILHMTIASFSIDSHMVQHFESHKTDSYQYQHSY